MQLDSVARLYQDVGQIYEAMCALSHAKESKPLSLVYQASGSSFRFDFKGLGDAIKEVKNLLVEAWTRIRYRKDVDLRENVRTVLEGLSVIEVIDAKREKGKLSSEEAGRLRAAILGSTYSLFKSGALPREIHRVETIANQELLEDFQQRLLPGRTKKASGTAKKPKTGKSKKKSAKQ